METSSKKELKYISLLHQETRNSRLVELSDDIDRLELLVFSDSTKPSFPSTKQAWLKLSISLKHSTNTQANRLKKISDIESLSVVADIYEKFDDVVSYQDKMLKINKLIRVLLIEYALLEITVPEKLFSKNKLNTIVANIKGKKTLSQKTSIPEAY